MDPSVLKISLLGGFQMRIGTDVVSIESGRVRSLLAWLALHGDGPQPRQRVAAALWPESTDSQARTNLRNLLHQLRRAVPLIDRYLDTGSSMLEWRIDAPIDVDAREFERTLSAARRGAGGVPEVAALDAALEAFSPLLPDCYEPWIAAHQARHARMHEAALEALLERCMEQEDFSRARGAAARMLRHDPLNERAHRARIVCLTALGDRAAAVRAYHTCESRLAEGLGVEPGRATRAAYEAALGPARTLAPPDSSELPDAGAQSAPRDVPLVGRVEARAALRRAWARALEGEPRMIWVTGEPGIGKTRLVQSLAAWIGRQGGGVVQARAYPTHGALAYGPIIGWLRSPALAPVVAAADPTVHAELARLLPELRTDAAPPREPVAEAERRQRLHDAVLHVLSDPASPGTCIVDDLHWSDRETIDLLHAIVLRARRPLLVVATVRTEEVDADHALTRFAARLAAADRLDRLELPPLDPAETGLLVHQLTGEAPGEAQVDALFRETEGNPLFVVETVRGGGAWGEGAERSGTSPRIRAVIEARLALLAPESRTVLQVAATLGREFTLPLLLRVSPLDEQTTLRGVDDAWRRRLVRERDDDSYDFSHDRIREAAYRTTSPVRRRVNHRRIADVIADAWTAGTAGPEVTLDQIALHYDRGGAPAPAVEWYERAARAATEISALDPARQLLERALTLLVRLPAGPARDERELDMRLSLGAVLVAVEGYGAAGIVAVYERARALCAGLDRPVPPPVLRALGLAALSRGDLDAGTRLAEEIASGAHASQDDVARVEGEYLAGVMAFWKGELQVSERRLSRAIEWYRPERHREHVRLYAQDPKVVCLSRLAWTLWHRGRVERALAHRDQALAMAASHGDPHGHCYALWFTQFIAIDMGDVERVAAQSEQLKQVAGAHRLHYVEAVADGFLGYVRALRGEVRDGVAQMRATIADPRWTGMAYVLKPQALLMIARVAAAEGDNDATRAAVREALDYLGAGPSFWKAPLLALDARAAGLDDRTGEHALPAFAAALEHARRYGSRWVELRVAIDQASWCVEHGRTDPRTVAADLARALEAWPGSTPLPATSAARILLQRLSEEAHP